MDASTNKDQESQGSLKWNLFLLFVLIASTFIILSYPFGEESQEELMQANLKTFNDSETLICSASVLRHSMKYQVSKSRGWQIQSGHFSKGDMLIEIDACKKSLLITNGGR